MAKRLAATMPLFVVQFNGADTVFPQVAAAEAGGNRVSFTNLLGKPVVVHHNGALKGDDDIELPAGDTVRRKVAADFDEPGKTFKIEIRPGDKRTRTRPRLVGDPTIIIL